MRWPAFFCGFSASGCRNAISKKRLYSIYIREGVTAKEFHGHCATTTFIYYCGETAPRSLYDDALIMSRDDRAACYRYYRCTPCRRARRYYFDGQPPHSVTLGFLYRQKRDIRIDRFRWDTHLVSFKTGTVSRWIVLGRRYDATSLFDG